MPDVVLVENMESTYPSFTANMGAEISNISWENIQNKPEIPPQYLRGVYSTAAFTDPTFPLPLDESWQPPLINGSYVMVGEAGTNASVYIADLSDNIWVSLGGGSSGVMTPEEVKTLYESNDNTNVYTDAEKSSVATYAKLGSATTAGAMSANDKAKLDTIAENATYNYPSDAPPSIPGSLPYAGGSNAFSRADHVHPMQTYLAGNADTANRLALPSTLTTDLAKEGGTSFNGANGQVANLGVKGTLSIGHGGTGATSIQNIYADLTSNAANNALSGNIGVRGILPIDKGGWGIGAHTANSIVSIDGTGAILEQTGTSGKRSVAGWGSGGGITKYNLPFAIADGGTGRNNAPAIYTDLTEDTAENPLVDGYIGCVGVLPASKGGTGTTVPMGDFVVEQQITPSLEIYKYNSGIMKVKRKDVWTGSATSAYQNGFYIYSAGNTIDISAHGFVTTFGCRCIGTEYTDGYRYVNIQGIYCGVVPAQYIIGFAMFSWSTTPVTWTYWVEITGTWK